MAKRKRYFEDPSVVKNRFLIWKYGITLVDYNKMLAVQGGVCATCGGPPNRKRVNFDVDHNHRTGTIRGLLCSSCNRALGLIRENPGVAIRMLRYIIGDNANIAPKGKESCGVG